MGIIGIILLLIQYLTLGIENIYYILFIPIMIVLMFILFQLRLIFGGADAKAIMALAILVPMTPTILNFPLWDSIMPFSWVIFTNSVILFLFIPISLIILNFARGNIEFPYCFLGYKMNVEEAIKKFVWPLEKIIDGKRKFSYLPSNFDNRNEFMEFKKKGIKNVWVTPKIPFMIPLLAGFLCSFIFGDILFHIMNQIL